VRVEIYSDVVCPWCYIGKRRFEQARERFDGDVEVVWKPYQLDPRAPTEATPALDAYARKFGGPEEALRITQRLADVGRSEGLDLDFGTAQRANTFDAHRLLWLARGEGGQDAVKERLLRAYFTEGRDIADPEVLVSVAAAAGLDAERVRAFLGSDEGAAEVRGEIQEGLERGVTAVPTFVFEGVWAVPGAQEPDTMLAVLERVRQRLAAPEA
jgi:predicted DsbA family dithiol-disulfide isomerase